MSLSICRGLVPGPPWNTKICGYSNSAYSMKWHRSMHTIVPLHPQTPSFRSKTEQEFIEKKNPHISEPMQFKPSLFKCHCTDKSTRLCPGGMGWTQSVLPIPISLSRHISHTHHACFLWLLDWLSMSWPVWENWRINFI